MAKIYVASSWRNVEQPELVKFLREAGHEVYDFRNPPGGTGFAWSQIDPCWQNWDANEYRAALEHPIAEAGFQSDMGAMRWADVCVLLLPCGRSAHLEAGWFAGRVKPVFVLTKNGEEPELMAKMCTAVHTRWWELLQALEVFDDHFGAKRSATNLA